MLEVPFFRIPTIVRGEDITLPICLGRDQFTHELIDVSTATEITATFINSNGVVQKFNLSDMVPTITVITPNQIGVVIAAAKSTLFKPSCWGQQGDRQIRIDWVIGGLKSYLFPSPVVTIVDPPFAAQP